MRALIRINLRPERHFHDLWVKDRSEYDQAVAALFSSVGFPPRAPRNALAIATGLTEPTESEVLLTDNIVNAFLGDETLHSALEVDYAFTDVPEEIQKDERKHFVMIGYTSEGQTPFIVCAVNPTELHIRLRVPFLVRLQRGCADICRKLRRHRRSQMIRFWSNHHMATPQPEIEVMEPLRDQATIVGRVINNPLVSLIKASYAEVIVTIVAIGTSITLFAHAPTWSQTLTADINSAFTTTFTSVYIQATLERIMSALMVTSSIAVLHLLVQYVELRAIRPIEWNSGIRPERNRRQ